MAGSELRGITAVRGRAGGLPLRHHRRSGHQPPGVFRAGEPDPADLPLGGLGRARGSWRTSWRTSGSATRSRSSSWRDIWLNEGFAQFLQTYYVTEVVGGDSMQDWLVNNYDTYSSEAGLWRLSIDDPGPGRLFDGAVYLRGSMAVQALRHRIGDVGVLDVAAELGRAACLWQRLGRGLRGAGRLDQRPGPHGVLRRLAERASGAGEDGFPTGWASRATGSTGR